MLIYRHSSDGNMSTIIGWQYVYSHGMTICIHSMHGVMSIFNWMEKCVQSLDDNFFVN